MTIFHIRYTFCVF